MYHQYFSKRGNLLYNKPDEKSSPLVKTKLIDSPFLSVSPVAVKVSHFLFWGQQNVLWEKKFTYVVLMKANQISRKVMSTLSLESCVNYEKFYMSCSKTCYVWKKIREKRFHPNRIVVLHLDLLIKLSICCWDNPASNVLFGPFGRPYACFYANGAIATHYKYSCHVWGNETILTFRYHSGNGCGSTALE